MAAALVARIREGDSAAEDEMVVRYRRGILYQLRKMTADEALCEDLLQDTLCMVLEKVRGGEVRDPRRLAGFIRNTARNIFIADYRKKHRRGELDTPVSADDLPNRTPNPQTMAERSQMAAMVHRVIGQMTTERDRLILFHFYVLQEDKDSICALLQIDRELFNRVLYRARRRFKELWRAHASRGEVPAAIGSVLFFAVLCHYVIRALAAG